MLTALAARGHLAYDVLLFAFATPRKDLSTGPEPALGRPAWKRGVLFCTVVALRFSSDKETAKCKKVRIPAVLECQPVQISPQYPCEVHNNVQTV